MSLCITYSTVRDELFCRVLLAVPKATAWGSFKMTDQKKHKVVLRSCGGERPAWEHHEHRKMDG